MQQLYFILLVLLIFDSYSTKDWKYSSSPARDLQPLFSLKSDVWLGADVMTSIGLTPDYFIWIMGDTLLGHINTNLTRNVTGMPRNSIGTMKMKGQIGIEMNHFIKEDGWDPHLGFFSPTNSSNWFWPTSGIFVNGSLLIFAMEIYPNGTGQWGWGVKGTYCIKISNPTESPWDWKYITTQIPHTDNHLGWSSAAVDGNDGYIYLLGNEGNGIESSQVLARILYKNILNQNWNMMQYWYNRIGWSYYQSFAKFNHLFSPAIPETTIHYHPYLKLWYTMNIMFQSNRIEIQTSARLSGPWSSPKVIYNIPNPWNESSIFFYAPKSHPEFANANEIILTYMSNGSWDDIINKLMIYTPQAIRVIISEI